MSEWIEVNPRYGVKMPESEASAEPIEWEYGVRWPDGTVRRPHHNEQPRLGGRPFDSRTVFVRRRVVRYEWELLPAEIAEIRQRVEDRRRG